MTGIGGHQLQREVAVSGTGDAWVQAYASNVVRCVADGRRWCGGGLVDVDVQVLDAPTACGTGIGGSGVVAGDRCFDPAAADPRSTRGQQPGIDPTVMLVVSSRPVARMTWSRAVSRAMVKPVRSGSVPGRDSAALTMAMRSNW